MLSQEFDVLSDNEVFSKEIPAYIADNLNPAFPLRKYQIEGISRLIYYLSEYRRRAKPAQLLFHLATGSGKTLVMAASILYLYQRGYRHFIFFVNSNNVLEKTKDNFLNSLSPKHQFAPRITIEDRDIQIVSVENFEGTNLDNINILFSTIQGLHSRLHTPGENQITFEDFENKQIVLLSDEAHHINALTKSNLPAEEASDLKTWETTVKKIAETSANNVMLEFTATIGMDNPVIKAKYDNRILLEYTLKQFRLDGFSKEVKVIQSDLEPPDRAVQALVISQYRRKVASDHRLAIKPVVLFKSRSIEDSKTFEASFHALVKNLHQNDLQRIQTSTAPDIVKKAFQYFSASRLSLNNLVREIQEDFNEDRCISVNSKNDSIEKQLIVNNLETNEYRVVFTVNMLNEGWDVLNLFDIVRLYNTRDAKGGKPGPTTIAEAQLIGRGARYFPFSDRMVTDRFVRKFDHEIDNEMRVLEELYYHSESNPRYIQELHTALVATGIIPTETKEVTVKVKESIKTSTFWQKGIIFSNRRIRNDNEGVLGFATAEIPTRYKVRMRSGLSQTVTALEGQISPKTDQGVVTKTFNLNSFGKPVIRKAIQRKRFFEFAKLKHYFPHLCSLSEFMESADFLGEVVVEAQGRREQLEALSAADRLFLATDVLHQIETKLKTTSEEFVGTKTFYPLGVSLGVKNKTLHMVVSDQGDQEFGIAMSEAKHFELRLNLENEDWYIYDENYGTYEEKALIKFIYSQIIQLRKKYKDVYLLRNEKLFQIYRFSDGAAIEPDFVLFMRKKDQAKVIGYQLLIDPKGEHLMADDRWKEDFLLEIEKEYKVELVLQNQEFRIIGLPFFNDSNVEKKTEFERVFEQI